MTNEDINVCIIILNWNSYDVMHDCIVSLSKINYKRAKIIIVDNGSKDGSIEKLGEEFDFVDIKRLDKNYGFAGGNNIGVEYANEKYNPEYLLLLNNDTIVREEFLDIMINSIRESEEIAVVVPKIYFYDKPDHLYYAGGEINKYSGLGKHYGWQKRDSLKYSKKTEITFANGCCMLIRKSIIDKIGLFDPDYFAVSEDTDLSYRLLKNKYKMIYQPDSIIWHRQSYSTKKNKGKWLLYYLAARNITLMQKKYLKNYEYGIFMIYFTLRWVLYNLIKESLRANWKVCRAILEGYMDGISNRVRYV